MIFRITRPSLKRRLLLTLLLPLCCILAALSFSGDWLANRMVQGASDRVSAVRCRRSAKRWP